MNILHVNCNYLGSNLHQLMVEKLGDAGVHNTIFVPVYSQFTSSIQPIEDVVVSECFEKRDRFFFKKKQNKIFRALEDSCNLSDVNLVHAYTLFTDGNVALNLKKKYNVPYVVAIRNTDVNYFFKYRINLRKRGVEILQHASAVFFLSPVYREKVYSAYIPASLREEFEAKTFIIPNGIDDFWLKNISSQKRCCNSEKDIKLVYAGRIDQNKNIPAIQKAMDRLEAKGYDVSLTVVGQVDDSRVYNEIIKHSKTQYIGKQAKEKLLDIYRSGDIFVMPSHKETFGLVYAEAMSQGLPVIYTRGQGFDGQFADGAVGYAVDSKTVQSVADGIIKVVDNYDEITGRCAESAKKFSWDSICRQYLEIYKQIVCMQESETE